MQFLSTNLTQAAEDENIDLPVRSFQQDDALLQKSRCERRIRYSSHKVQAKADVVLSAWNEPRGGKKTLQLHK